MNTILVTWKEIVNDVVKEFYSNHDAEYNLEDTFNSKVPIVDNNCLFVASNSFIFSPSMPALSRLILNVKQPFKIDFVTVIDYQIMLDIRIKTAENNGIKHLSMNGGYKKKANWMFKLFRIVPSGSANTWTDLSKATQEQYIDVDRYGPLWTKQEWKPINSIYKKSSISVPIS